MKTEQEHTPERITIKFISTAGNYFIIDEEDGGFISLDPNGAFAKELLNRYNCLAGISNPSEWVEKMRGLDGAWGDLQDDHNKKDEEVNYWNNVATSNESENRELREALKDALEMMEQTKSYRKANGITGGDMFLNCAIDKAKQLLK